MLGTSRVVGGVPDLVGAGPEPKTSRARVERYPDDSALERFVEWSGPELLRRVMAKLAPMQHGIRSREFLLLVNEVMAGYFQPPYPARAAVQVDVEPMSVL